MPVGYTFMKSTPQTDIQKDAESAAVLRKLRAFLDAAEPQLVYFLVRTWNLQSRAITYKELREAILRGEISADYLEQWYQDYSHFVIDRLQPAWQKAIVAAAAETAAKFPGWHFNPAGDGIRNWTEWKAAEFVTNVTTTQIAGLRALVQRAAVSEDMNVDQLARAIRPMVGLTRQQSMANLRYHENLIKNGVSKKKALDLSARYAARQHRYRGYNIARTELAFAYNQGSYEAIKQAQAAGYLGEIVKVWCTAADERSKACRICRGLERTRVAMDDDFDFETKLDPLDNPAIRKTPPAHPSCRCAVKYVEVGPPIRKPAM